MNKKVLNIRLSIQFVFFISTFLGGILFYFQSWQQQIDTKSTLKIVYERLEKNYIINIRPVDNQTECNKNETAISAQINEKDSIYNLDYIEIGEENNKQSIRFCLEIHYDFNFFALKQKKEEIKQEQNDCFYKGISFKSIEEINKCPLSDIKLSTEESIPNYEKIEFQNSNKLNLFLKRSDVNDVPLTDIYLKQDNFKGERIKEIQYTSFSMDNICKKYYNQFSQACQLESKPKELNFSLFQETSFAIDCDENSDFLSYNTEQNYNYFVDMILSYQSFFFYFLMFNNFGLLGFVILSKVKQEKIGVFFILLYQFYFTYMSYFYQQQYFSKVIQLLEEISYFNEDPLKNIYEESQSTNLLLTIFIWFQIILYFSDFTVSILSKSKKALKFVRLEEIEME